MKDNDGGVLSGHLAASADKPTTAKVLFTGVRFAGTDIIRLPGFLPTAEVRGVVEGPRNELGSTCRMNLFRWILKSGSQSAPPLTLIRS